MNGEARKLHLIEALIKVEDEKLLADVEKVFSQHKLKPVERKSFKDFAGIWTEEEAEKMKKDIEEACGQIHPDDWK